MPRFLAFWRTRLNSPQEIPKISPSNTISRPFLPLNPLHPRLRPPHEPTSGFQSSYQFPRNPLFPASGLATGSFNGLNPKSKFLAF